MAVDSALTDPLVRILERRDAESSFSGVVALSHGRRQTFTHACGYANRSWKVPNDAGTHFRLASVSKLFTAVAVLQLVEQAVLALDTRIVEFLGLETTAISEDVNIEHLLTMTAGIGDWLEESEDWTETWERLAREHPIYLLRRNADYLPLFAHKPPLGPPGEKYRYSNSSYILLGLAIERATGTPFFDYVRRNVFGRAGMTGSYFVSLDELIPKMAEGYVPVKDAEGSVVGWKKNYYLATPAAAADGGATSTAADLIRFLHALRNPAESGHSLLSPSMTRAILEPRVPQGDERTRGYRWMGGYGFTFMLGNYGKVVRYGKPGEEDGVSCRLYHYPGRNLDVVILGNQSSCALDLGWEIHDLIIQSQA